MLGWLDANFALNEYCCCVHIRYHVPGTWYLVQGTDRQTQFMCGLSSFVVSVSYEKNYILQSIFFLIRSIRNNTCLHEFKNEVTNRRGKKTPFFNLKKKSIRNSLRHI